jgi:hypothetical protein
MVGYEAGAFSALSKLSLEPVADQGIDPLRQVG